MKNSNEFSYKNPPVGSATYAAYLPSPIPYDFMPPNWKTSPPPIPEVWSEPPVIDSDHIAEEISIMFDSMKREMYELQDMQKKLADLKAAGAADEQVKELEASVARLEAAFEEDNVLYDSMKDELRKLTEQERKELSVG